MEKLFFTVDNEKATQALNFFAIKNKGSINTTCAIKLIFFADRYHLRKYGRPVTGDEYYAMGNGPVASLVKDLAESRGRDYEDYKEYNDRYITHPYEDDYYYISAAPLDEEAFSESDREALEFSWRTFGHLKRDQLIKITHAYPEWHKYEKILSSQRKRVAMSYLDFFEDPTKNIPHMVHDPFEITKEDKAIALERAKERSEVNYLWAQ